MNRSRRSEHAPFAGFQFSADEMRVLRECNKEAFFQRSVPLSSAFGIGAYYMVKNGVLQAYPKFGAAPQILFGIVIGYLVGKFSYQRKCAEKLMALPNSRLAEIIRQRKAGVDMLEAVESVEKDPKFQINSSVDNKSVNQTSNSSNEYDDTAKELPDNSDDTQQTIIPTYDSLSLDKPINQTDLGKQSRISYEEMRMRNREKYTKLNRTSFQFRNLGHAEQEQKNEDMNEYGDTWTN